MTIFEARDPASAAGSFDPGPAARSAGPWTRLRRALVSPQPAVAQAGQFDPGLYVQLGGPWTRLRRTGTDLVVDLPFGPGTWDRAPGLGDLLPLDRLAGIAARAAPLAVAAVGTVAVASALDRPASPPAASEAVPAPRAAAAVQPRAKPMRSARPRVLPAGQVEARLVGGKAVLPEAAPPALKGVVDAANRIADRPYAWGGGHGSFESLGYDCSGAVSYALHGANLIDAPRDSGGLASWGEAGEGRAITVYANPGHAYAVIAGLRWDTSGTGSSGPRWQTAMRSPAGYVARHPAGL